MLARMFNADWHMKNRRDEKVMTVETSTFLVVDWARLGLRLPTL